jgi:hypothetical protein
MLASARHQFIYIHVPRTAGRSIRRALRPYSDLKGAHVAVWARRLKVAPPLPSWQISLRDHATALQIRDAAPADFFQTAFKFAIVRNPWDWHVSMHHFLKENPKTDVYGGGVLDFPKFVQSAAAHQCHCRQRRLVADEHGQLMVDFLGRYESLERDFEYVQRVLGIRGRLRRRNRSHHRDFRSYYTPRLWQIVARRCREDIRLFGYEPMVTDPHADVVPPLPAPRQPLAAG